MARTDRLKRNLHILRALKKPNRQRRREILKHADKDLICSICDCAKNILNGNIPVTETNKNRLKKHKQVLRQLADPTVPTTAKKTIFKRQEGGFLSALIPALLGPVLSLITGR